MSGDSWKAMSEKYKIDKKKLIDGYEDAPHTKKKKKKKNSRSNHKHKYVPAIYHMSYKRVDGKAEYHKTYGHHCEICGRVKDMYFLWFDAENKIKEFKKENPDCLELILPEDWDYFKDKYLPI